MLHAFYLRKSRNAIHFIRKTALCVIGVCNFLLTMRRLRSFKSFNVFNFNLIYVFMSRHEVHSMNTHTLQNAGWYQPHTYFYASQSPYTFCVNHNKIDT